MVEDSNIVEVNLDKKSKRPVIEIDTGYDNIKCLIDTGAMLPVWCDSEQALLDAFPYAHQKNDLVTTITGFGGSGVGFSEIWEIPKLELRDRFNSNTLTFSRIPIAVLPREGYPFEMILNAALFDKVDYGFINSDGKNLQVIYNPYTTYIGIPVFYTKELSKDLLLRKDVGELVKAIANRKLVESISILTQDELSEGLLSSTGLNAVSF